MKGDKNLFEIIKTGYYNDLENIERPPYGLKVYFGKMGSGKTLSMVRECYDFSAEILSLVDNQNIRSRRRRRQPPAVTQVCPQVRGRVDYFRTEEREF